MWNFFTVPGEGIGKADKGVKKTISKIFKYTELYRFSKKKHLFFYV